MRFYKSLRIKNVKKPHPIFLELGLKAAIQSEIPLDEAEVSKEFAAIFVTLLGEIEQHYPPGN